MQEHHDQFSLSLLRNDPDKFLLLCQPIIKICIRQYTASGMFRFADEQDIRQSINEKLFASFPSIERNFDGRVLLKTYINVVIRNICLKIYEERNHNIATVRFTEGQLLYMHDPTDAMVIDEELERLHTALQLFHNERHKVYLYMKLYFKIPLHHKDIQRWDAHIQTKHKDSLLSIFGKKYDHMFNKDIYEAFAAIINRVERNKTTGETIRRWTDEHINAVLKLMNGNPPRRAHSRETLLVLFSEEYSRSINKEY